MNNTFDVLIVGGGVSGMSCALVLGSAKNKPFAAEKKIGIFTHQKSSALQEAVFNNAYGITPGKLGSELLSESKAHLSKLYSHIIQIPDEKVVKIPEGVEVKVKVKPINSVRKLVSKQDTC